MFPRCRHVRYWPKADMPIGRTCPRLGVKRTSPGALHMSAFDPKRKSHLAARRTKSVIALHAPDFMYLHPAFDKYRESYPQKK